MIKKNFTKSILFCSFAVFATASNAAVLTYGYFQAMPNEFWPNTTKAASTGDAFQQKNPFDNPDVFCRDEGNGYRLPSIGEFNADKRSNNPFFQQGPVTPAHWSNYKEFDTSSEENRLPNQVGRTVGSLGGEWGALNSWAKGKYSKGFNQRWYWATEPAYLVQRSLHDGVTQSWVASTSLMGVICVRDLVPTPANQTGS